MTPFSAEAAVNNRTGRKGGGILTEEMLLDGREAHEIVDDTSGLPQNILVLTLHKRLQH